MADANATPFNVDVNMGENDDLAALLGNPEMIELDDEDATAGKVDETSEFYKNILDELDEKHLQDCIFELRNSIDNDRESRSQYDKDLADGLNELGFNRSEITGAAFPGASTVRTPLLAQAAIEYQSQAKKELMPQSGPVRAVTYVDDDPELEMTRQRVEDYFNYLMAGGMEDYSEGFDQLLFMLPLLGSVFRKVYFSGTEVKVDTIPVTDFLVPWSTKALSSCPRATHVLRLHKHEVKANFRTKLWKKADLQEPDEERIAEAYSTDVFNRVIGLSTDERDDERYMIYECHTYLSLEEEDEDPRPYIVTFDAINGTPLAVRRNWVEGDVNYKPRAYFVHYKFLPWNGFYGIGLIQVLGGLAKASSGSLRALMDAAMANNLPGGLVNQKAVTAGQFGNNQSIVTPFSWTKINVPTVGGDIDIRKHFLPFSQLSQPSSVLMNLLTWISQAAEKFGSINIRDMMSADKQAPVGTTLALIEQQGIIFSGIHERQHRSLAREIVLMRERLFEYLGDELDAETVVTVQGSLTVYREDFDGRVAAVPASDPSIFSAAQRVSQAQASVQLAQQAKEAGVEVDLRVPFMNMAKIIGVKDVDKMFPEPKPPEPPPALDPASEFAAIMNNQPAKAAPGQNHRAHIDYLVTVSRKDPYFSKLINPQQQAAIEALIGGHVAAMAMEEAMGMMGAPLPSPEQAQGLPPQVNAMVAQAVAGVANQMAANRPISPDEQDAQGLVAAAREDTARKAKDDALKAQLRVAEIAAKEQQTQTNNVVQMSKVQLDREKFEHQRQMDAAQLSSTNALEQDRISSIDTQRAAEIESRERIVSEQLASNEAIAAASLASKEQIEAAKLDAQMEGQAVDAIERRLGDQRAIAADIIKSTKPAGDA